MSQVNLISTGSHRYNGVWLKAGDSFVADNETDASELCCTGFARRVPQYETRVMLVEQSIAPAPHTKRAYHRRDLTAK